MDPRLLTLASTLGLSASVGLNTTLPLLMIGLAYDFGLLSLTHPYDALGGPLILSILGLLAILELGGDKIPIVDTMLHVLQTPIALGAGAIIAGSQTQVITGVNPQLVIALGLAT